MLKLQRTGFWYILWLDEGVAIRPSDIDVVWVYGYAWPKYRGGITYYADQIELDQIVQDPKCLAKEYDPSLGPLTFLKKLASLR